MQWSSANTDWTVQALGNKDGIGLEQLEKIFATEWNMPIAQNGAATGTYFKANGGTAPLFTTNTQLYRIRRNGMVEVDLKIDADAGTDGAGAVSAQIAIPTASQESFDKMLGVFSTKAVNLDPSPFPVRIDVAGGAPHILLYRTGITAGAIQTSWNAVQNGDFTNGDRHVYASFSYKGFD